MSGKNSFQRLVPFPLVRFFSTVGKAWTECWDCLRLGAKFGVPGHLIWFGLAPGDDLLCTAVHRELHKRGVRNLWMMSKHPEIFQGNADVDRVVPVNDIYPQIARKWVRRYDLLTYYRHDEATGKIIQPTQHVIAALCARADITGEIALRPYFHLTQQEIESDKWATGKIAIQSSGLDAAFPSLNKQWYPERFQAVVDQLKGKLEFVQIGSKSDPLLKGALDFRGRPIRESASILASCRLYIGGEGFLMHLARAVECPSVIIYGGRVSPQQIGYCCNTNLYTPVPCSPCWERDKCDFNRTCMDQIGVQHVVEAVGAMLDRPRGPLDVEKTTL